MKIIGLLRVKNEVRWIERCLRSLQPLCERMLVFDDHSEDGTPDICLREGADVILSPFAGLNEPRDKNFLLRRAYEHYGPFGDGSCAVMIDGDEILSDGAAEAIREAIRQQPDMAFKPRILYLWDREDQVRWDGVYSRFWRPSIFPLAAEPQPFMSTGNGGGFHCSSIPAALFSRCVPCDANLLHLGYLHREDRIRKWRWYNEHDPGNVTEQAYIHVVQGDIPEAPAEQRFRWGGPLDLRPIAQCLAA